MSAMEQRRDPVVLAWVLGLGLAGLAYAIGPQYFLFRVVDYFQLVTFRIGEMIGDLSLVARDVVRSLAIGLYGTFVVLSILVIRRGGRAKGALFWVTILFMILIGATDMGTDSNSRWVVALALSGFGAIIMTGRLRSAVVVS